MRLLSCILTKITDYKSLVFQITTEQLQAVRALTDALPSTSTWTWTDPENNERCYLKINLDRFDKAVLERKFSPLVRKVVNVDFIVSKFTNSENETFKYAQLKNIKLC